MKGKLIPFLLVLLLLAPAGVAAADGPVQPTEPQQVEIEITITILVEVLGIQPPVQPVGWGQRVRYVCSGSGLRNCLVTRTQYGLAVSATTRSGTPVHGQVSSTRVPTNVTLYDKYFVRRGVAYVQAQTPSIQRSYWSRSS